MKYFVSALLAASALAGDVKVNPTSRTFVDDLGRTVLFHGVNVVYKQDPYIPDQVNFDSELSLNAEDIDNLKNWGMNFVRLGVMWEAVERSPGVYDDKFLDQVESLINRLGEAGIYTLVDAHQDVFARSMCGEGVPDFYAKQITKEEKYCVSYLVDQVMKPIWDKTGICKPMADYNFGVDENEDPIISDCQTVNFALFYNSQESMNAFSALWNNQDGLSDKFEAFWNKTSQRLGNNKYVVGYDPINEPFLGNYLRDPKLMIPGHFDKTNLAPLYERLYKQYQTNDPGSLMVFEPAPIPDELGVLGGLVYPVGFEVPPGGEIGSPYHVLNDHTYCCQLSGSECTTGEPKIADADKCLAWHNKRIGQRSEDATRLGLPLLISEFGACLSEGPCTQEIMQVADVCDDYLVGWAYWEFKNYKDLTTSAMTGSEGFYNPDGSLQDYKVKALARSYMMLTQGVPTQQSFDMTTAAFSAEFTVNTDISGESVLYTNKQYYYPNGFNLTIARKDTGAALTADQVTIDLSDNRYVKFHIKDTSLQGKTVSVKLVAH